jgi:hypothetical protein
MNSYIKNCYISPRPGDTLFISTKDGIIATLDGYAIIPMEDYEVKGENMYKKRTEAHKMALSASLKAAYARKKAKKFPDLSAPGISYAGATIKPQEVGQATEDRQRNYEFHYRRGLVAVMEMILRELR